MLGIIPRIARAWPLVARRSLTNWKLLSTVVIGVLLASAIMAGTVIYFDALRELALRNALNQLTTDETNIVIKSNRGPTTREEAAKVVRVMDQEIARRVQWILRDQIVGVKTATFFLTEPGNEEVAGTDNSRGYVGHLPRLYEYITILPGGRKPGDVAVNAPGEPMVQLSGPELPAATTKMACPLNACISLHSGSS